MRGQIVPVYHPLSMLGRGVLHDSEYLYVVIITIFGFSNGIAVIRCGSHSGLLCRTNRTCANAVSVHAKIFWTSSNIRSAG